MTTIRITQPIIDAGPRSLDADCYCWRCPIAQALRAATGDAWCVARHWAGNQAGRLIALPPEAVRFHVEYDQWVTGRRTTCPGPLTFEVQTNG